jgi:hypothetical protein
MTSAFESPRSDDIVLGGDQLPVPQALVLGGVEGLLQRFPRLSPEEQQEAIWRLVDQGDAGLQQVIATLQSPHRSVRQTAYELLQMMPVESAQDAVAPGFPLYPGEVIYQVHESGIIYNDCWYDLITHLDRNQEDYPTRFLERYIDVAVAELAVQKNHQSRAVNLLTSGCFYFLNTASVGNDRIAFLNFAMLDWCKEHRIPIRWPGETQEAYAAFCTELPPELSSIPAVNQWCWREWKYEPEPDHDEYDIKEALGQRVVEFLVASSQHELMGKLWMEAIGPLAFIHQQPVNRLTYCDIQADGSIVILRNQ